VRAFDVHGIKRDSAWCAAVKGVGVTKIKVKARDGHERTIEGQDGLSLMQVIRDNGIDEVFALCGGCCSCGTCHVYVSEQFLARMPEMHSEERDLLEALSHRRDLSRLSCQIPCTPTLDGVELQIAPTED
jgi:ferredoxin, 2Fe-2S